MISQAQNPVSILDKAASAYENSNGITASFELNTRSDVQKVSESFEGTINMKGDKFTLVTPDMITWFDGTTQWTYVERNDEVNVSTPSGEELQFTNPALLLRVYKKGFIPKYIGESTASNGKTAYDIELTPKKKAISSKSCCKSRSSPISLHRSGSKRRTESATRFILAN